jgi:hypothetical protein
MTDKPIYGGIAWFLFKQAKKDKETENNVAAVEVKVIAK